MNDMAETILVVGLGNPGKEYERTRHNIGFQVIDLLAEFTNIVVKKKKFGAVFGQGEFADKKLILLKPQKYMNCSGQVVATAIGFYRLTIDQLLVASDDMNIDVGRIRIRKKGSSGGQKGLNDIIEKIGSDEFARLRIGIGHSGMIDPVDYVLSRPGAQEKELLDKTVEKAVKAILCWVEFGTERAMNEFNV